MSAAAYSDSCDPEADASPTPAEDSGMDHLTTEGHRRRSTAACDKDLHPILALRACIVMTHGLINFDEAVDMEVHSMGVPSQSVEKVHTLSNRPLDEEACHDGLNSTYLVFSCTQAAL
eukprot:2880483-Amphidinium_carterae.1